MNPRNGSENTRNGQANTTKGNRLAFHGDRHFTYDARGNLTEERRGTGGKLQTKYTYNSQNQLIKVEKDNQVFEYAYDPLGRRIRKKDAFGETEFVWNGDVLLSEKRNHAEKLYLYEPNSFKPLAFIENNQCYFYHLDHLGTPQELTNWEGQVVWSARYRVYGNVIRQDVEEVQNNLRFQGQYYDEETGLHYNRHRYYDPNIGNFITPDPIGLLGGVNNYAYASNPVMWIDPLGLSCKEINGTEIGVYDAVNPGPLPDGMAGTFAGGRYSVVKLEEDAVLYRAGTADQPLGQFFSKEIPESEIQTRIDKAVLPVWPGGGKSPIDTAFAVKIPKGTEVYIGEVGSQGGSFVGGTEQIVVLKPWEIEGVQVLGDMPLP